MTEEKDVAVTGIGLVSPIGVGANTFWEGLTQGRSGITLVDDPAIVGVRPRLAALTEELDWRRWIRSRHRRRMDKLSRMLVAAGRMALEDGEIEADRAASGDLGVVIGTSLGNVTESILHYERLLERGPAGTSPMMFPNLVLNAPAGYLGGELGATGTNLTVCQGETTGEQAILLGVDLLRQGRAELVLAGAGEELSSAITHAYDTARALSGRNGGRAWSSPYDRGRNGVVLGEGAAVLLLEPLAHARARKVRIYAVIDRGISFGVAAPRHGWPNDPGGACRPLAGMIRDRENLDLIIGSANSSRQLDGFELDLFNRLVGERTRSTWLTSIKGAIGEFGSAGALAVAAASLALERQAVPPLCSLEDPEAGGAFHFPRAPATESVLDRALVAGFARGGNGAALGLRRA